MQVHLMYVCVWHQKFIKKRISTGSISLEFPSQANVTKSIKRSLYLSLVYVYTSQFSRRFLLSAQNYSRGCVYIYVYTHSPQYLYNTLLHIRGQKLSSRITIYTCRTRYIYVYGTYGRQCRRGRNFMRARVKYDDFSHRKKKVETS